METITVKDDYLNKRINKRIYFEEDISIKEYNERQLTHQRLAFAIAMREKEAQYNYNREHKNGYCPHCGMLIPLNGECDCGYTIRR